MLKKMGVVVMLGCVLVGQVYAEEEKASVGEIVAGAAVVATPISWATIATNAVVAGSIPEYSGMGLFAGAIAVGVWREIVTDPAKVGKFRYAGQEQSAENRKWTRMGGTRWMGLAAYDQASGPVVELTEAQKYSTWLRRFDVPLASRI